jgi:hypothetical protein
MSRRERIAGHKEGSDFESGSTWWDRRDDPPRAVTETVGRASNVVGRLIRPEGDEPPAAETDRARLIRTAVLSVTFLVVVWLVLAAIIEQT